MDSETATQLVLQRDAKPEGPQFEDVCKEVEIPRFLPPTLDKRDTIEVLDEQTAALRRIADLQNRGIEWSMAGHARKMFIQEQAVGALADIANYLKIDVMLRLAFVTLFAIWLVIK